jgi:hypothetical protein
MSGEQGALVALLAVNAALVFGYRVYRLSKGGPPADAAGGALLAVILGGVAVGAGAGATWAKWAAFIYALIFGLVVMPIWTLGVLIPMHPKGVDYAFTGAYWVTLLLIGVVAILI